MLHTAFLIVAGLVLVGILSAELETLGIRNQRTLLPHPELDLWSLKVRHRLEDKLPDE
jgi:hypothetical protein